MYSAVWLYSLILPVVSSFTLRHDAAIAERTTVLSRHDRITQTHALRRRANEDVKVTPIMLEHLQPLLRPDARRIRLYYGPYKVFGQNESRDNAPHGMDPNGVQIDQTITGFCSNCTVLSAKTDTHYLNGTRASISTGLYNHHILILDPQKHTLPWWLCPGQSGLGTSQSAGFMVTGVDEAANLYSTAGNFSSGYYIPAASASSSQRKFNLNAELINYRPTSQEVYITAETEFLTGAQSGWRDASMSLLSVTGCSDPGYRAPHDQARYNMTSPPFTVPRDGHIIAGKGHVHDGGVSISLSLNNVTVCDSRAVYGGDGSSALGVDGAPWETIREMSACAGVIEVRKGDVLSVTSVYDTSLHPLRKSADGHGEGEEMGTFFINFAAAL